MKKVCSLIAWTLIDLLMGKASPLYVSLIKCMIKTIRSKDQKVKEFNIIIALMKSVAKNLRPRMIWMNHKPSFASFLHLFIGGGGGGGGEGGCPTSSYSTLGELDGF